MDLISGTVIKRVLNVLQVSDILQYRGSTVEYSLVLLMLYIPIIQDDGILSSASHYLSITENLMYTDIIHLPWIPFFIYVLPQNEVCTGLMQY